MDSQIIEYITDSRRAGMPDDIIRTNLLEQGWTSGDIKSGFAVAPVASSSFHLSSTYRIVGLIAVILVLVVGTLIATQFRGTSTNKPKTSSPAQASPTTAATPTRLPVSNTPTPFVSTAPPTTPRPTRTPSPTPPPTDSALILMHTNTVLNHSKNRTFTSAIPYFWNGGMGQLTPNDIITALSVIEASYRTNNIFDPRTSAEKVIVIGNKGQVLVECLVNSTRATIRFDFTRSGQDWKIETISVGAELNLSNPTPTYTPTPSPTPLESAQYEDLFAYSTFSSSPTSVHLPTGDIMQIAKTKLTNKTESIRFTLSQPYTNYFIQIKDIDFLADQKLSGIPTQIITTQDPSSTYIVPVSTFNGKRGVIEVYQAEEGYNESSTWQSLPIKQIPFIID